MMVTQSMVIDDYHTAEYTCTQYPTPSNLTYCFGITIRIMPDKKYMCRQSCISIMMCSQTGKLYHLHNIQFLHSQILRRLVIPDCTHYTSNSETIIIIILIIRNSIHSTCHIKRKYCKQDHDTYCAYCQSENKK